MIRSYVRAEIGGHLDLADELLRRNVLWKSRTKKDAVAVEGSPATVRIDRQSELSEGEKDQRTGSGQTSSRSEGNAAPPSARALPLLINISNGARALHCRSCGGLGHNVRACPIEAAARSHDTLRAGAINRAYGN